MTSSGVSTAAAISPDSGEHWAAEGAWRVADGVWRIPLPLPMDGLKAVNVYVIETEEGITLVDGGWAIPVARELLERCLRDIGFGFTDLRRFLVTHVHRDHFTLATVLGHEFGAEVSLGIEEKPAIDLLHDAAHLTESPFVAVLRTAGALEVADQWVRMDGEHELPDAAIWAPPDVWLQGDQSIAVGTRTLDAVHTPGHTPGHYVFAEQDAGLLFAGDHVLPTITPSIGFTVPPDDLPLGRFLASLRRVTELPDLTLLPAHGPVAPSSHARAHELLAFHEARLSASLAAVAEGGSTADEVARRIGWTRHERDYAELDVFSQGMAAMETKAHLELLVVRGQATARDGDGGIVFAPVVG
ncbi:MBL fold metallo-hydrolase [Nocardioides nanhaiensis]|uniref:MBL fold metallo-hydrolase n=1 Tax=Nocardioides nanhaiensis TaxID=1476871 RepID=A0ABP8W9I5_9ACTN